MIGVLLAAAAASATPQAAMPGIWSIGETPNCSTGPAWVFLADGYYVEVKLPDGAPSATGLWRDEGKAIAYTHSHMPFSDRMTANALKRLTIVERTVDRLVMTNARGDRRAFSRCPADALKAPTGQAAH